MNDNRNYGLDIARIIATKIRNYKRDFSVFEGVSQSLCKPSN